MCRRGRQVGMIRVWILVATTSAWATPAAAVDLAQVDRTIAEQPAYQSKMPKYCLVVFGPEAKSRMWLVTDGDVLHVDRNGKGDWRRYTKPWRVGDIVQAGKKYRDFRVARNSAGRFYVRCTRSTERRHHYLAGMGGEKLAFAGAPDRAPVLHFGGPLTTRIHLDGKRQSLVRGRDNNLCVYAGVPGLGKGTFTFVYGSRITKSATIRFPAADGGPNGPRRTFHFGGC